MDCLGGSSLPVVFYGADGVLSGTIVAYASSISRWHCARRRNSSKVGPVAKRGNGIGSIVGVTFT